MPGLGAMPSLHPLLVHFPIALWLTALAFWTYALMRDDAGAWKAGRALLYLGTIAGIATLISGYLAAEALGHDSPGHDRVHVHRDYMIVTTALAALTAIAAWIARNRQGAGTRVLLLLGLGVTAGALTLGADRGGELVYRYGMGVSSEAPPAAEHGEHSHGDKRHDAAEQDAPKPETAGHHGPGQAERHRDPPAKAPPPSMPASAVSASAVPASAVPASTGHGHAPGRAPHGH